MVAKKSKKEEKEEIQLEVVKKIGHDVDRIIYEASNGNQFKVKPVSPFLAWDIKDKFEREWEEENEMPPCPVIEIERVDGTTYDVKHDDESIIDKINYTDKETGEYDEETHKKVKEEYLLFKQAISQKESSSYMRMLDAMMYFAIEYGISPERVKEIEKFIDLPSDQQDRKIKIIKYDLCSSQQDMIDIMSIMTALVVGERRGVEEAKKA